MTLTFSLFGQARCPPGWGSLEQLAEQLSSSLFIARTFAVSRDAGGPVAPPRHGSDQNGGGDGSAPWPPLGSADAAALDALDDESPPTDATSRGGGGASAAWAFDAWALTPAARARLPALLLHKAGVLTRFRIPPTAVHALAADVAAHMGDSNPFHNHGHVLMVMNAAAQLLEASGLRLRGHGATRLKGTDALALLLAALCHDLEHVRSCSARHFSHTKRF